MDANHLPQIGRRNQHILGVIIILRTVSGKHRFQNCPSFAVAKRRQRVAAGVSPQIITIQAVPSREAAAADAECCRRYAALRFVTRTQPTAYAVGYVLAPLRGCPICG